MKEYPRVAFFTDSYNEVNDVAQTSHQFVQFASCRQLPLLCVNAGARTTWSRVGAFTQLELQRGRIALRLNGDLHSDLLLWRHYQDVRKAVRDFAPDLIHVTGPGDVGQLGAYIAHKLKIPLVASWHTNIHEYAAHRLRRLLPFITTAVQQSVATQTFNLALRFYKLAQVLLAPNEELQQLLQARTGKPVFLMQRGVDPKSFSPAHRLRMETKLKLGYVGRLQAEKNVRAFAPIEEALVRHGINDYQFVIVGAGREHEWLNHHLQRVVFTGTLSGQSLARTYANFDLFVLPSQTDAFGNVVLEALASGVPAIVMASGGPKFIVEPNHSGFVARDETELADIVVRVARECANPERMQQLRAAARARALTFSWARVFAQLYEAYEACLSPQRVLAATTTPIIPTATAPVSKS